ncbi:tRNA (Guanine-1)-methyltransferase family protein, partial [Chlamydia psittaci 84-8471/1]
GITF